MLRRLLLALGALALLVVLAATGFVVWASASTLPPGALATTRTYGAPPAAPADTLTLATYNIGYLSGMTNNLPEPRPRAFVEQNEDAAVALLRALDADVIGFQEIDFGAARSYDEQQLDTLATRLGYHAAAQAVNWDERYLPFPGGYFDVAHHFGRVVSGQALLSRYPLAGHRRHVLARPPRPFLEDLVYIDRLAQVADVQVGARTLTVVNVHLEAFDAPTRQTQAAEVRRLVASRLARGDAVVVLGDFNSVLPAERPHLAPDEQQAFASDSTLAVLTRGLPLRPAFADRLFAAGALGTYPADGPTHTIDHVLVDTTHFAPAGTPVIRCTPPGGPAGQPPADHCAVAVRLAWR